MKRVYRIVPDQTDYAAGYMLATLAQIEREQTSGLPAGEFAHEHLGVMVQMDWLKYEEEE